MGGAATATTAGPGFALPPPLPPPRAAEVPRGVGEGEPLAARCVNEQRWIRKVGEMGRSPRASSGGTTSSSWILPWTLPCADLLKRCTAMMEFTSVSTTQSIYQLKTSKIPVAMSGPKIEIFPSQSLSLRYVSADLLVWWPLEGVEDPSWQPSLSMT